MSRDLVWIALSLFTWGLGESAFFTFQPLYLQQLGANPVQIGAILGGYGLMAALAHIPAGYLADRIGRRPLMLAAWIQGAVAAWLLALANSLPLFVLGMFIYGMTAYVSAPMSSYVTNARGSWSVGRALTLTTATYSSGAIIGPMIGGLIGQRLGYRPIFLFGAVLFILSNIFIFLIHSQPTEKHEAGHGVRDLLVNRRYLIFLSVYILAIFSMYLPQPLSPNFLQNQRSLSLVQIGQLSSINSTGIIVIALILGRMEARTGYLVAQASVALFSVILWKATGMFWFGTGYFLLGGFRAARSLAMAHIRGLVSSSGMGLAYGVAETGGSLALVLAPALAGILYDRIPEGMYIVAAGLVGFSLLVSAWVTASQRHLQIAENTTG